MGDARAQIMSAEHGGSLDIQALYSDHHRWLFGWLRSRLGCVAQAEDLTHDTYLRLLQRPAQPRPQEPRAFLTTIARGLVIDHWRRESLRRAWLEALASLPEAEAGSPEQEHLVLELLDQIAVMLDGLRPRVRTAFLLAQLEGIPHADIAARLGVSVRSVERYVAEALFHCYTLRYAS